MIELLQFRHSPYNEKVRWAQPALQALDFVAERAGADGYLVGSALSLADLTAASTLAVLAQPPHSPTAGPQPYGAAFATLLRCFEAHPAVAWTRQLYARHRDAGRDFDGPSGALI